MKTILIYLINFLLNPVLFVDFSLWGRRLKLTPFKRQQYSLLSANLSMFPVFSYGYRLTKVQAQLITAIFEIDHYVDQVIRGQPDYQEKFVATLTASPVSSLVPDLLKSLTDEDRHQMQAEVARVVNLTETLDTTQISSIDQYFDLTSFSIAMPCITKLVELLLGEELSSPTIMRACAEIIRIVNDGATIEKDKLEGAKNAYLLFPPAEVDSRLKKHIAELEQFQPQNRTDLFLKRLTKLGLLLYKKKDFEL